MVMAGGGGGQQMMEILGICLNNDTSTRKNHDSEKTHVSGSSTRRRGSECCKAARTQSNACRGCCRCTQCVGRDNANRHRGSHHRREPPPATIAPVCPTSTSSVVPLRCCSCRRRCHRARAGEGQRQRWRRHWGTGMLFFVGGERGGERERGKVPTWQPSKRTWLPSSTLTAAMCYVRN
jgi:hypothetical protein